MQSKVIKLKRQLINQLKVSFSNYVTIPNSHVFQSSWKKFLKYGLKYGMIVQQIPNTLNARYSAHFIFNPNGMC